MKNYNSFINESDIDPYNEENWDEEETDERLKFKVGDTVFYEDFSEIEDEYDKTGVYTIIRAYMEGEDKLYDISDGYDTATGIFEFELREMERWQ